MPSFCHETPCLLLPRICVCMLLVIGKISWIDRVRNEEVLQRVNKERNIVHARERTKANWIGYILHRNCLQKHVIEGKIEVMARRGRRCKQLLDDLKERIL